MEKHCEHKSHSGSFWAYVLIIVGVFWILKKNGWDFNLPEIGDFFTGIANFFGNLFHLSVGASLPIFIILAGIVLLIGRKFFSALLLVILFMIFIPHFLILPGILMVLFFPLILIIIGIVILSKLF